MIQYLREKLLIKTQKQVDQLGCGGLKGKISDGYHTFGELYEHRNTLFIALCRELSSNPQYQIHKLVYRTPIKDGYFLLIINQEKGEQISYHLPKKHWEETGFAFGLNDYKYDGHTSNDVLDRLNKL